MPYPITETVRAYLRADRAWPYVGKPPKVNCKTWPVATGLTLTTHQASRQPSSGKCVLYSMHVGARHGSQAGSQPTALTGGVRRFGWVHDGSCRWFLPRALIGSFLPPRQGLRRESCSPTRRRGCPVRHHTTSQQADASTTIFSLPLPARPTRYNRAGTPAAPGARWCPLRAAKSLFDSVHAATGHGPRWHRTGGGGQFDRIGRIMVHVRRGAAISPSHRSYLPAGKLTSHRRVDHTYAGAGWLTSAGSSPGQARPLAYGLKPTGVTRLGPTVVAVFCKPSSKIPTGPMCVNEKKRPSRPDQTFGFPNRHRSGGHTGRRRMPGANCMGV